MSTPAIIVSVWYAILMLCAAHAHGHEIKFRVNFWFKALHYTCGLGLLYWGGFFA